MDALPDNAIGTLTQFLCHIVSLIHNKLLIKNLENLSPLYLLWHDGLVAKLKKTEADVWRKVEEEG